MQYFFSIIIPTLNEEKYLPVLLTNLKNQKEKNFEVIIVDGHSEDKTIQKAEEFKSCLPLSFYKNERKNVAYQRNFGARCAQGKYLVFLDADAGITSAFSKNLQVSIQKLKGLVFIPYTIPEGNDSQIEIISKLINFLIELSQNTGKPFSAGGNMIWEKNFFLTVGGFDESVYLSEDHKIIQEACQWGVRAKFLHKVRVKFSMRRMRTEGKLVTLYKSLLGTGYLLLKGDVKNKIYKYEMGGGSYSKLKEKLSIEQNLKRSLDQIREFFKQYLS